MLSAHPTEAEAIAGWTCFDEYRYSIMYIYFVYALFQLEGERLNAVDKENERLMKKLVAISCEGGRVNCWNDKYIREQANRDKRRRGNEYK